MKNCCIPEINEKVAMDLFTAKKFCNMGPVWPDLAKSRHFWKKLSLWGNFEAYLASAKVLNLPTLAILCFWANILNLIRPNIAQIIICVEDEWSDSIQMNKCILEPKHRNIDIANCHLPQCYSTKCYDFKFQ